MANQTSLDWKNYSPPIPKTQGIQVFKDVDLGEIRNYIDWTPFFSTWMLKGKYPQILENPTVGAEAKKLYEEANAMLDDVIAKNTLQAHAVVGVFPAIRQGEDVVLFRDEARKDQIAKFHFLRQQGKKGAGVPNVSLVDFVAPEETGLKDYFGAFAVSAGFGAKALADKFEEDHDDDNSIMIKAVADRLAEALAEMMHEKVRKEIWGYAASESLTNEELIKEKYKGIRPAPGYPACPDHTEKPALFELLQVEKNIGVELTESNAMFPAASVSGFYFSHPEARYFGLGKIQKDQVEHYASRKGMSVEDIERWLAPNLGY